ncbi:hypothetical protein GOBAR_AA03602 [Gossypium barbadense]|uniref:K-box domain-containing protein n=1 Tax=Gossypium barbadense TaxID=3634 RepID=A0A2P5YMZ7_GOSBA|nr:hypothetical protein GOBAR_AA03602 [Gossypium barbadense]
MKDILERKMRGEELHGLDIEELQQLEKSLEIGLSRVMEKKAYMHLFACMIMGAVASTDKDLCKSRAGQSRSSAGIKLTSKNVNEMTKKEVEFDMVFSGVFGESIAKGHVFSGV